MIDLSKKLRIKIDSDLILCRKVQEILLSLGFKWNSGAGEVLYVSDDYYVTQLKVLIINNHFKKGMSYCSDYNKCSEIPIIEGKEFIKIKFKIYKPKWKNLEW